VGITEAQGVGDEISTNVEANTRVPHIFGLEEGFF